MVLSPFYSWETSQGFGKKVNIEKFDDGGMGKESKKNRRVEIYLVHFAVCLKLIHCKSTIFQ